MRKVISTQFIVHVVLLAILGCMLYWKFDVSVHRYFDIDEFAHMHWGHNFYTGAKPYSDFLYFFPPVFLFVMYPIFALMPKAFVAFTALRVEMFVVFAGLVVGVALLTLELFRVRGTRGSRSISIALLTAIVLVFLPIPYDKFLEVRPDTLATAFTVWGMWMQVRCLIRDQAPGTRHQFIRSFLAGLFYGLALATVPKVIFFIPGAAVLAGYLIYREKSFRAVVPLLAGVAIPAAITLAVMVWSGEFTKALYLTTSFASNSTRVLGEKFPMRPDLFFYPNDTFYGQWGYSAPLVLNLLVYLIAGLWGSIRLMTAFSHDTTRRSLAEFFIALTFVLNFLAFVKLFPLKHTQYFISIAPFAAIFFADFVQSIAGWFERRKYGVVLGAFCIVGCAGIAGFEGYRMYGIKIQWKDWNTSRNVQALGSVLPTNAHVFDLIGESVFYKDPYYVCCLPYGQYIEAFSFQLPSLAESLTTTKTAYVYPTEENRLGVLPPQDQVFIRSHYVPLLTTPYLMVAGADVKFDAADEKKFEIIVPGEYEILQQGLSNVQIDGKPLTTRRKFETGRYTIKTTGADQIILRLIK